MNQPQSWPWPHDSREDKAKRVAASYRRLLIDITQGRCDDPAGALYRIDRTWEERGIHWHLPPPRLPEEHDDWLSAADIAHYIQRTPRDIYNWARRGHIEQRPGPDGAPQYLFASVIAYAGRRTRRKTQQGSIT